MKLNSFSFRFSLIKYEMAQDFRGNEMVCVLLCLLFEFHNGMKNDNRTPVWHEVVYNEQSLMCAPH